VILLSPLLLSTTAIANRNTTMNIQLCIVVATAETVVMVEMDAMAEMHAV
jgi:hypothetical protein